MAPPPPQTPVTSEHKLWSPYWTTEKGFNSELQVKNNLVEGPLTFDLSVYTAGGQEYLLGT